MRHPSTQMGMALAALSLLITPVGAIEHSNPLFEALHGALEAKGFEGPSIRRHIDRIQTFPETCLDRGRLMGLDHVEVGPDGGALSARAEVEHGGNRSRCWVRARVQIHVPTVVTRRAVPRGEVLGAQDLTTHWQARTRHTLSEPAQAIGRRVKRALKAQEAVVSNLLDLPRVIARGDRVQVSLQQGGVHLRTEGEALMGGPIGAPISVRLKTTKRVVKATILDRGHVEVLP